MNSLITATNDITVTSLEIAEHTGKRHDHVLRDIRDMMEELETSGEIGLPSFGETSCLDSQGKKRPMYSLDKELTIVLISGYSAKLRLAMVQYIGELESKNQLLLERNQALELKDATHTQAMAELECGITAANNKKRLLDVEYQLSVCKLLGTSFDVNQYVNANNLDAAQSKVLKELSVSMGGVVKELGGIDMPHLSMTAQLNKVGSTLHTQLVNEYLVAMGVLTADRVITEFGKRYGFNWQNGNDTAPRWYNERFGELHAQLKAYIHKVALEQ